MIFTTKRAVQALFLILMSFHLAHASTFENLGKNMDDSLITTKIKALYASADDISAMKISVSTKNGIVTLKGSVDTEQGYKKAIDIAKNTHGVKSVNAQQLEIKQANSPLTDAMISAKIDAALLKNSLFKDKNIPLIGISVKVSDGHVTLNGEVKHAEQIPQIMSVVEAVKGVKSVKSNIKVKP